MRTGRVHVLPMSDHSEQPPVPTPGTGNAPPGHLDVNSREVPFESLDDDHFRTVLTYWSDVRGDRLAPAWGEFDLLGLPSNIIPSMTVVDLIHGDEPNFRYRFWGTRQAAFKARDYTGLTVRDLRPDGVALAVIDQYKAVLRARAPLVFRHNVQSAKKGIPLEQTTIRLPLSDDGETVNKFASYCSYPNSMYEVQNIFADYLGRD